MDKNKIIAEGITFDDVLLIPAKSDFVPSQADTRTRLTKNITINIPLVVGCDGHCYGICAGNRAGPGRRHRHNPQKSDHRCSSSEKSPR